MNETGTKSAVRKFKGRFPKLTVRSFKKKYLDQVKNQSFSTSESITVLRRRRPLLLGSEIDEKVRKFIISLRYRGGQATFSIAIAVANALIQQSSNESLKILQLGKDWAQSMFRRMGFKKRAAATGKVTIPDGAREEAQMVYLYDIRY